MLRKPRIRDYYMLPLKSSCCFFHHSGLRLLVSQDIHLCVKQMRIPYIGLQANLILTLILTTNTLPESWWLSTHHNTHSPKLPSCNFTALTVPRGDCTAVQLICKTVKNVFFIALLLPNYTGCIRFSQLLKKTIIKNQKCLQ